MHNTSYIMPSLCHCDDYSVLYTTLDETLSCNWPLSVSMSSDILVWLGFCTGFEFIIMLSSWLTCICTFIRLPTWTRHVLALWVSLHPFYQITYNFLITNLCLHQITLFKERPPVTNLSMFHMTDYPIHFSCDNLLISLYSLLIWQITHSALFTVHVTNYSFQFIHFSFDKLLISLYSFFMWQI